MLKKGSSHEDKIGGTKEVTKSIEILRENGETKRTTAPKQAALR